jgi:predicted methyltransferase
MNAKIPACLVACLVAAAAVGCGEAAPPPPPPPGAIVAVANPSRTPPIAETPLPKPPAPPAARPLSAAEINALLDAPDRTADDRKLDDQRKAAAFLGFLGIGPGMQVAEVGSGSGYTSELLARAVGPTGKVYGQNTPEILAKFAEGPWSARLAKPVNQNIVRKDAPFEAPLPGVTGLDVVVNVLFYHDTVWLGVDRDRMNRAVFAALKPGGVYVVVDHSARTGDGVTAVKTAHRIEQSVVEAEVEKAGFKLAAKADFLKNPADTRDWNDAPNAAGDRRGTSDRFVLKFVKP